MKHTDRSLLPERVARYLSAMPPAISGSSGHNAAYTAAHAVANGFALDEETSIALLLAHYNSRCLPRWSEAELRHKVRDALANPSAKERGYLLDPGEALPAGLASPASSKAKWPASDPSRIATVLKDGPTAAELTLRSPGPLDAEDAGHNCTAIVDAVFADPACHDPLLCIGKNSREFNTRPLSAWLASGRLSEFSFIVPARMTAKQGRTKAGKLSDHTLENTGSRVAVVVEFDAGTADEHAARLWHLDSFSPLALVVHSGGKSLHGWFPVMGIPSEDVRRFMRYAASLGADPALFRNPSQFVRLPGGTREGGCRQSVFYWDPAALVNLEGGSR